MSQTRNYEFLLVLRGEGGEQKVKESIEELTKSFAAEGFQVEQVQNMEKKKLSYAAGPLDSGYYVNFVGSCDPAALDKIRAKLDLENEVYRHSVRNLGSKSVASGN